MENKNYSFSPDDFQLIRRDGMITDTKLKTKPTTFFRDALRRFCKNKSSVMGAIILGILILMAIVVPWISDKNIDQVSSTEKFLAPKMFKAGTGFWDGTRKKERILFDTVNEVPALSEKYSVASLKSALIELKVDKEPTLIDQVSEYARGGWVMFETDATVNDQDCYLQSKPTTFTADGGYKLTVELGDEADVNDSKLGQYRLYIVDPETGDGFYLAGNKDSFSREYGLLTFDISAALSERRLSSFKGAVTFEIKSSEESLQYLLIKSLSLTANDGVKNAQELSDISFDDASRMVLSEKSSNGYWSCTGRKGVHSVEVYYCDYTVDTYMLVYGDADEVTYSKTDLEGWISNGWCEYDSSVGPESFKVLSDECPIERVVSQKLNSRTKKLDSIRAVGWNYKKLGYKEMPKFLLGTDAFGYDLFTKSFAGLRTSLILGVCTMAFCFVFGLIWGAISGYFGGWVDLLMERFCEILSGVPWIVVMTLAILHLGNNFFTFFLALCMTGWMGTAARTRTQFYRFKGREYVLASRTLGSSDIRLIFRHVLPNAIGTIITGAVLMIPSVIFSEATLAYLQLGLQGVQSFGVMMANNQQYLSIYPNLVIFPAVIIALMMISFNLFGNGLRDAFNPSLKGSE